MKTKVFLTVLFILNLFQMNAQVPNEVTLVVSADGANKEEAVKTALRSAIEQAYGTFVSSNTSILNDELVKDEIVTLSSGNIKGYKELSNETLPNGHIFTTLRATVGIPQLIDYAKSKGAEVEFAGATFAMNIKMEELNTRNEEIIVANMLKTMEELYMKGFDYKMEVSKVQANGQMTADIDVYVNDNAQKAYELFYSTLESVSLNETKIKEYKELGKDVYMVGNYLPSSRPSFRLVDLPLEELYRIKENAQTGSFAFRSEYTLRLLSNFFNYTYLKTLLNICISTNTETSQIQLISSFGKQVNDIVKTENNLRRYGDNIDTKIIFDQKIAAYARYASVNDSPACYQRFYVAKDHLLNYIQSIIDIKEFCFFAYNEEGYAPFEKAFIVGYPKHEKRAAIHHIKLNLQIPLDDLMKISKFTITNSNE